MMLLMMIVAIIITVVNVHSNPEPRETSPPVVATLRSQAKLILFGGVTQGLEDIMV